MAGQAHYTSAPPRAGGGQGGFQFTGVSAGAQDALAALKPLMAYAPPPGAPSRPDPGELAAFPVSFAYDLIGGAGALTVCRYLGQDYSGRYGNYFGHSVLASHEELVGVRPVELWGAPLWAAAPALDGRPLPDLGELPLGSAVSPDRVRRLFHGTGSSGIQLLEHLMEAVLDALGGRGAAPRVVLVSADTERIVDWLSAVSYALPAPLATELTFTTYTDRPRDDRHHIVGTVPEAWERAGGRGTVFFLDDLSKEGGNDLWDRPCRAARLLTQAWGDNDMDVFDTVADIWSAAPSAASAATAYHEAGHSRYPGGPDHGPEPWPEPSRAAPGESGPPRPGGRLPEPSDGVVRLRAACALVALCRGDMAREALAGAERRALEGLLDRFAGHDELLPEDVHRALADDPDGVEAALSVRLAAVSPGYWDTARRLLVRALNAGELPDGPPDPSLSPLAQFVDTVVRLRLRAAGVAPEQIRDAAATWLLARPAPFEDVVLAELLPTGAQAAPAGLPEPYRRAVLSGLLSALESSAMLRGVALTTQACELLVRYPPDPLGVPEGTDPWAVAPRCATRVLHLGTGHDPAGRRAAALRVLRLYRRDLLGEDETYDAVRDLVTAGPVLNGGEPREGHEPRGGFLSSLRRGRKDAE